jgi:hypothetical protein
LRKKSGQAATKKYLYADCLQFLLKVTEKDGTESSLLGEGNNVCTETRAEEEMVHAVQEMDEASTSGGDAGTLQHRRRKASKVDEIERKILKSEKLEPDEDEAFFISVLPYVRQLSPDDKIDFRIVVLKAIKDIKTRSATHTPSTYSPNSTDRLSQSPYTELAAHSRNIPTSPADNRHSHSNANVH